MPRLLPLLSVLCLTALPLSAQTWQMATPYGDGLFQTQTVRDFARDVARATGGGLQIEVHSGASLHAHGDIAGAVAAGDIQLGEVLLSVLSGEGAAYGLDSLPFSAVSYEEAEALWDMQRPLVEAAMAERGLMPLYSVAWPPQGLYTRVEITDPAELRGLKLRTYNATMDDLAEALGMVPVRIEVKDIPDAIARGDLDVMITSATTGASTGSWDYFPYFYDIQAWLPKNIVFVNRAAFDALPLGHRQAMLDAAAAAEADGTISSMIDAVEAVKTLFDRDVTIITSDSEVMETADGLSVKSVSPALLAALEDAARLVTQEWLSGAGAQEDALRAVMRREGTGG